MSNRFHSKHHRFSHHTVPTSDPRWPDSGQDPIASHETPFLGDFVMMGTLSAITSPSHSNNAPLAAALEGNVSVSYNLSADNITFTGDVIRMPSSVVTDSEKFLVIKIVDKYYGLRLWDLPPAPFTIVPGSVSATPPAVGSGSFVLVTLPSPPATPPSS